MLLSIQHSILSSPTFLHLYFVQVCIIFSLAMCFRGVWSQHQPQRVNLISPYHENVLALICDCFRKRHKPKSIEGLLKEKCKEEFFHSICGKENYICCHYLEIMRAVNLKSIPQGKQSKDLWWYYQIMQPWEILSSNLC